MDFHWMTQSLGHYLGKSEKETLVYPVFWKLLCSKSQSVRRTRTHPPQAWAATISLSLPLKTPFQV